MQPTYGRRAATARARRPAAAAAGLAGGPGGRKPTAEREPNTAGCHGGGPVPPPSPHQHRHDRRGPTFRTGGAAREREQCQQRPPTPTRRAATRRQRKKYLPPARAGQTITIPSPHTSHSPPPPKQRLRRSIPPLRPPARWGRHPRRLIIPREKDMTQAVAWAPLLVQCQGGSRVSLDRHSTCLPMVCSPLRHPRAAGCNAPPMLSRVVRSACCHAQTGRLRRAGAGCGCGGESGRGVPPRAGRVGHTASAERGRSARNGLEVVLGGGGPVTTAPPRPPPSQRGVRRKRVTEPARRPHQRLLGTPRPDGQTGVVARGGGRGAGEVVWKLEHGTRVTAPSPTGLRVGNPAHPRWQGPSASLLPGHVRAPPRPSTNVSVS